MRRLTLAVGALAWTVAVTGAAAACQGDIREMGRILTLTEGLLDELRLATSTTVGPKGACGADFVKKVEYIKELVTDYERAYEQAKANCEGINNGEESLAWMHKSRGKADKLLSLCSGPAESY